jgi:putative endonuclease
MERGGYVYILTNINHRVLYIGVTSNLKNRMHEHKMKFYPKSFASKYNCTILIYFESYASIEEAIAREKQLKNWKRIWKIELIKKVNPNFIALHSDDYD